MRGADGGVDPGARPEWQWDVALSFAGAQRDYVERVAEALRARQIRCFYDADEQIELWGKYLAEELPAVYSEQAAAVVVFISAEYAARDWTRLERRAALDRAVRERREYILPARFDNTPLPGLLSGMVAIDLRTRTPNQLASMIAGKLAELGITGPAPSADARDPARAQNAGSREPRRDSGEYRGSAFDDVAELLARAGAGAREGPAAGTGAGAPDFARMGPGDTRRPGVASQAAPAGLPAFRRRGRGSASR